MNTSKNINLVYVIFLSLVGAIGGFLFGYDTAVISGTITEVTKLYELSESGQGWYVGCALIGSIIGVLLAGQLSDRIGRKPTLWLAALLFMISAIGCMFAPTFNYLVLFRILGGMGIGMASIVSPLYISEISTPERRGSLVSLYQLAITIGIVGSYLANAKILEWSKVAVFSIDWMRYTFQDQPWRAMLGLSCIPAILFFIILFFIPESPRWQMAKNRTEKARKTLSKLFKEKAQVDLQIKEISEVINTESSGNWRLLFKPGYRLALLIGVSLAILGQFMGVNVIFYYGPIIFEEAGMGSQGSLDFQIIVGLVNVVSTILGMLLVDRVGRKKLVYFGVSGMLLMLISIGVYFLAAIGNPSILLILIMIYVFFCAISICVVIWVLLSEMYPVKVRGVAMSIAGLSLWVGTFLVGQLTPILLTNLSPGFTFLLFAAMCIPYLAITYFLVPETTGKSLEEIERIWTKTNKEIQ